MDEFVDEKTQNSHACYVQIQFAMYALKVKCSIKKVTTKTIIVLESAHVVNVKRLMMYVMLPMQWNVIRWNWREILMEVLRAVLVK